MPTKDFGRTLCVNLARTENRFTKKPKYLYSCNDPCGKIKGKKNLPLFWKRKSSLWNVQSKLTVYRQSIYLVKYF